MIVLDAFERQWKALTASEVEIQRRDLVGRNSGRGRVKLEREKMLRKGFKQWKSRCVLFPHDRRIPLCSPPSTQLKPTG